MLTTDRISRSALCLLALFVMWESRMHPLGIWRKPGPGYFPVLLAALLVILGALVWAMGGGAAHETDARRLADGVRKVGHVEQT